MSRARTSAIQSQSSLLNPTIWLFILNALTLVGVGLSVLLSQHFYDVRTGSVGFKSFCNISETMNCDLVAASPYSEFLWGLPLSSFAAGWFLSLFVMSLIAHNRFWRRDAIRACLGLSLFGTLAGIPYAWIMATKLRTYCILCLGVDGVNLLALLSTLVLKPEGFSEHQPNRSHWKVFLSVCAGSLLISVIGLKIILEQVSFPTAEIADAAKSILDTPPVSVNTSDEFPSIGLKTAPITIVEFSDFQCPYCRMAAFSIHSVTNRYPGQIRIIFRNYPLDQACNPAMPQTAHPVACEAARVALCANKQGKFEETYEQLFEKQATFSPGRPLEIVKDLGIDTNRLQGCTASPEIGSAIAKDIEEGTALGVKSTPTFFINGHRVEGAMPATVWNRVIDQLLIPSSGK